MNSCEVKTGHATAVAAIGMRPMAFKRSCANRFAPSAGGNASVITTMAAASTTPWKPISRMPTPKTSPAINVPGQSSRCRRIMAIATNSAAPATAKPPENSTAREKNTPLSAEATAPMPQTRLLQFICRKHSHAAMPSRNRHAGG